MADDQNVFWAKFPDLGTFFKLDKTQLKKVEDEISEAHEDQAGAAGGGGTGGQAGSTQSSNTGEGNAAGNSFGQQNPLSNGNVSVSRRILIGGMAFNTLFLICMIVFGWLKGDGTWTDCLVWVCAAVLVELLTLGLAYPFIKYEREAEREKTKYERECDRERVMMSDHDEKLRLRQREVKISLLELREKAQIEESQKRCDHLRKLDLESAKLRQFYLEKMVELAKVKNVRVTTTYQNGHVEKEVKEEWSLFSSLKAAQS